MNSSFSSLFSIRNFVLVALATFTIRSLGATTALTDPFSLDSLQSSPLEQAPSSIIESFLLGSISDRNWEVIPVYAERSFIEEVLDGQEYFILTSDSEVNPRIWMSYLAPEGLSFENVVQNTTVSLQALDSGSLPFPGDNSPPEVAPAPSGLGDGPYELDSEVPFEIIFGIDLSEVASSELELMSFLALSNLPQHTLSDFQGNIPEPSSSLLLSSALTSSLLARKRR